MSVELAARIDRPGLAPLWDELTRRWSASDRPVTTVTLRDLNDDARRALADLLGSDVLPPVTARISVGRVASALGTDVDGLRHAVSELRGPLGNRAADRASRARRREEMWSWVSAEACARGLSGWAQRLRAKGGDVGQLRVRIGSALTVIDRLPADGIPLSGLACDVLGDPHALDHGTWLGATCLDAITERTGADPPTTAEDGRRLWAAMGVVADGLSSSVLCLGLSTKGDDPLSRFLDASASACEPVAVTLSQLQRWPVRSEASAVFAFENPSILAEAARRLWKGPPLLCTGGWPNVAVITLLRQLTSAGSVVRYHGDFDTKGVEIANMLVARVGAEPWRMNASDYEASLGRARIALSGEVPEAVWDPPLASAMRNGGRVVYEEDLRDTLLELVRASSSSNSSH